MPIIRTFAPFVAGIGHMHYGRFQLLQRRSAALAWVLLFVSAATSSATSR